MLVRRFPRAVASIPALVAFVREFFTARGLDAERAFDVDLVIEELFTNMVRHARGGGDAIEVALDHDAGLLTVRLRDENVDPWDPAQAPPPDFEKPTHQRRAGGLGIYLVHKLSRDVRFEHANRTTTVTARLEVAR
jgi:anti-sigma regulatory factor (Ser/Thr protein kinase)